MTIDTLIDKKDTFEIVRDKIALILATETANQQALALAASKDPADFKFRVFTERSNPWSEFEDDPVDTSPLVNVWFDTSNFDMSASNVMERQKSDSVFIIDCYGYGKSEDNPGGGHIPGDRSAAFEVQRCIKLIRNILMASIYTYLDLPRGTVWSRSFRSIKVFQIQIDNQTVQNVHASKCEFGVTFNEFSPQFTSETLEEIFIDVLRAENGEILVEADYVYPLPP